MKKPNILFIMADQMSAKALPFYGHPVVKAPALSRLAAEGVVFENAYCNSPLCGPSRTSMMSGLLPSKVGGFDNAHDFSAAIPTLAHYLRLGGYRTCLSGKMHFTGPDQLHGYEERLTTDIYPSDFGWTPNWAEPEAKVTFQDMTNVLEAGPCLRSLQIDYDDEVATKACAWLYDRARDDSAQPVMLTVSFTSPHDPYVARPEFWDIYAEDEIDLPKVPPIPVDEMDPHSARIHGHYSIGDADVTDDVIRRARHGYYASIEYVDSKVAALMQVLEETDLARDMLVVFVSDHGDMMGERGLYYKKSFYEWSSRVPMIFWAGDRLTPGRCSETVSLLDLLPTFAQLAGTADQVLEADGASLLPCLSGGSLGHRTIPAEFLSEGVFEPAFMMVQDRLKLLYSESDPPILFDLGADPDELRNVAGDARYDAPLNALMAEARATWDVDALSARIIKDQNRRRLIDRSHKIGAPPVWDYQPFTDASKQYVRAGKWTTEVEALAHLPPHNGTE
ncbi:choline-sulfatase [Candidatus Rhodobacter oscarellae]|nr:choline-sulfatase [Candidatus Rhodobacter lobularis]